MNNTTPPAATNLPMTARAIAYRAKVAAEHAAVRNRNRAQIRTLIGLLEGATTVVSFEGEGADERVVFTSATTGQHSLDLYSTDGERFVAHLYGFLCRQPDTKGEWFKIRTLARGEQSHGGTICDACDATLPVASKDPNAVKPYVIVTDFGVFCTMGCAIMMRDELADATGGAA